MSLATPDTIDRHIRLARVRWRKMRPRKASVRLREVEKRREMTAYEMELAGYSPDNISAIMMQRQR